jgi:drug/metabolite transporter (DMT)-like permease
MNSRTIAALVVTMLLWGSAFSAIREAVKYYDPVSLALWRFVFASAALSVYAIYKRMRLPQRRDLPVIVILGAIGIAGYHILLNIGETEIDSGTAAFLICTAPVFTALIARFYLKEHLRVAGWAGIALSLAGVMLIAMGRPGAQGLSLNYHALLVLGSAFCASIYTVVQKPYLQTKYSALEFTTYVIWAGTLCMLFVAPKAVQEIQTAPARATLLAAYLGVFPAAIAYVTWTYVLANMPVSRAVSFLYIQPPLATIVGWISLKETPQYIALVGGLLALAGVVVVNRWGREIRIS